MHSSFITVAAFAALATAKKCQNATVPVQISARTGVFGNLLTPSTDLEVTTFVQNMTQQGRNFTDLALTDYKTTEGTYNISARFCQPDMDNSTNPVVQVLTHGIGFDKTYWDLSYNNYNYSYIDSAIEAGYCTLSYDRLGVANSSIGAGDPRDEIQSFLEVEVIAALTRQLREGQYPGVNNSFERVVHVGHSFGSAQTYALVNKYPDISDGIVLTGFSTNSSFIGSFLTGGNFQIASTNAPIRFGNTQQVQQALEQLPANLPTYLSGVDLSTLPPGQDLPAGYLISNNIEATQLLFFYPGGFDPAVLPLGENSKQAVTVGELLTVGSLPMMNAFTGPVMVINGVGDLPFCGGDCLATGGAMPSIQDGVKMAFPGVDDSNFTTYTQMNTGHGINLHYNATAAYEVIQSFFMSKNLQTS